MRERNGKIEFFHAKSAECFTDSLVCQVAFQRKAIHRLKEVDSHSRHDWFVTRQPYERRLMYLVLSCTFLSLCGIQKKKKNDTSNLIPHYHCRKEACKEVIVWIIFVFFS